jgi:hypothetical protein
MDPFISADRWSLTHLPGHWIALYFITSVHFAVICTLVGNLAKPDKRVKYKQNFVISCTCGRKYEWAEVATVGDARRWSVTGARNLITGERMWRRMMMQLTVLLVFLVRVEATPTLWTDRCWPGRNTVQRAAYSGGNRAFPIAWSSFSLISVSP